MDLNSTFANMKALQKAIKEYNATNQVQFRKETSDLRSKPTTELPYRKISFHCTGKDPLTSKRCDSRVEVELNQTKDALEIVTFVKEHSHPKFQKKTKQKLWTSLSKPIDGSTTPSNGDLAEETRFLELEATNINNADENKEGSSKKHKKKRKLFNNSGALLPFSLDSPKPLEKEPKRKKARKDSEALSSQENADKEPAENPSFSIATHKSNKKNKKSSENPSFSIATPKSDKKKQKSSESKKHKKSKKSKKEKAAHPTVANFNIQLPSALSEDQTTKRTDYIDWETYFMGIALLSAKRSKDPNTQVGACIIDADNKVVAIGYNGMPNGCSDDNLPWGRTGQFEDTKYAYVCHAEMNAIMNKNSHDVKGCTLYATTFPCNECAKLIIQAGIKEVVYLFDKHNDSEKTLVSKKLLSLARVATKQFHPKNPTLEINFMQP